MAGVNDNSQNALIIDFMEESESLKILPNAPMLCSQKSGWKQIHLQYHHQPSHETPEHTFYHHGLVVFSNTKALEIERLLGDSLKTEHLKSNEVVMVPANVPHICRTREDVEFLVITLEPQFTAQTAYELFDPEQVELKPSFAHSDPLIYQIGLTLKAELESHETPNCFYIESLATVLSAHLLRHYCTRKQSIEKDSGGLPKYKLKQAIAFINEHLNENLSLAVLAQELGISQYYFCRLFKQSTGYSPHQYLIQQRVERAKELLSQRKLTIAEIAETVGFYDQSRLTRYLKRLTGLTPKQLQNK